MTSDGTGILDLTMSVTAEAPPPALEKILNVEQAAVRLGVAKQTVYRMVASGRIPYRRVGGQIQIPAQLLEDWIKQITRVPKGYKP